MKQTIPFLLIFFVVSSCIEILDDITFNIDGSGTFRYTLNLSSSQVKINSILALDSLDGKRVPSLQDIQDRFVFFSEYLSTQEGISNVQIDTNYSNYICKIKCDFTNVYFLQVGFHNSLQATFKKLEKEEMSYDWITWNGNVLTRKVPDIDKMSLPSFKSEDSDLLKKGNYTSITRFENQIDSCDNPSAILSKNEKAVMLRKSVFDVINHHQVMDNIIYVDSTSK
jgi:hypothetical protein